MNTLACRSSEATATPTAGTAIWRRQQSDVAAVRQLQAWARANHAGPLKAAMFVELDEQGRPL